MCMLLRVALCPLRQIFYIENIIFLALGGILMVLGPTMSYSITNTTAPVKDADYHFALVPRLILSIGVLLVSIGTIGLCGACVGSTTLLYAYLIVLSLLFISHLGVGIFANCQFTYGDSEKTIYHMRKVLLTSIAAYDTSSDVKESIDYIQKSFVCCGADGPSDYKGNVPDSCCKAQNNCNSSNSYKKGCLHEIYYYVQYTIQTLGIIAIVFSMAELFGMVVALLLALTS